VVYADKSKGHHANGGLSRKPNPDIFLPVRPNDGEPSLQHETDFLNRAFFLNIHEGCRQPDAGGQTL
jgi:hypothetical protein